MLFKTINVFIFFSPAMLEVHNSSYKIYFIYNNHFMENCNGEILIIIHRGTDCSGEVTVPTNSLSDRCVPNSVLINCLCLSLLIILLLKMMFVEGVNVLALHFAFSFVWEVHWYTEIKPKISLFQLFLQSYMMLCYSFACTYSEKTGCCYLEDTCVSLSVA